MCTSVYVCVHLEWMCIVSLMTCSHMQAADPIRLNATQMTNTNTTYTYNNHIYTQKFKWSEYISRVNQFRLQPMINWLACEICENPHK